MSIPRVDGAADEIMLSEIGADMSCFSTLAQRPTDEGPPGAGLRCMGVKRLDIA
jgi:hypothetical protein